GEVLRVDAALGETARDEPEARLRRTREHVAQLVIITEPPDRADARRHIVAEQFANEMLLALVSRRQNDEVCRQRLPIAHPRSLRDELGNVEKLCHSDLATDDQVGTADIEVIAAAAGEVLELPTRPVVPEIEFEASALERIEQVLVQISGLFGQENVTP